MSFIDSDNQPDDENEEGGEEKLATVPRNQIRHLEKKAKAADKAEEEAAAAKRELAFLKAGIDTESSVGKLFAKAYEGDLDVEAIKTAWSEVSGAKPETEIPAGETTSTDERAALAANATPDTGQAPPRPVRGADGEAVRAGLEARNEHGASWDDAAGVTFNTLVGAAMEGDRSVIIDTRQE